MGVLAHVKIGYEPPCLPPADTTTTFIFDINMQEYIYFLHPFFILDWGVYIFLFKCFKHIQIQSYVFFTICLIHYIIEVFFVVVVACVSVVFSISYDSLRYCFLLTVERQVHVYRFLLFLNYVHIGLMN